MAACPHCGQNHRKFPESCEARIANVYGQVVILHYGHPVEPGVDPNNEEELMLSRIRLAAPGYARQRSEERITAIKNHIKYNSEVTKVYFAMRRYLDENWPGQRRGA